MKKLSILLAFFIAITSCKGSEANNGDQQQIKRYKVESGIIIYEITVNGKVMGSTISGSGTEKLYFKDWGAIELVEEQSNQTTSTKFFGKKNTETTNTHTMSKLDNGESYHVDFDKKEIYAGRDMAMDMVNLFHPQSDAGDVGKTMAEGVGGKIIGKENFLGYPCEIYDIMGSKQWIYKGVSLKSEMTIMGITTVKKATSAKFNVSVANKYFKLPDYPIQKEEGFMDNEAFEEDMEDMNANMEKMSKMSFNEWKKLIQENDPEMEQMSDKELRETFDMMQKMIKMRKGE
ncbi:MAG: hypothetical protein QM478_00210 [Flavobacteriaceae bacterium]